MSVSCWSGLVLFWLAATAFAQTGPQTGRFQLETSLLALLGESRAASLAAVMAPDEPLSWEVFVPALSVLEDEGARRPPGLLVYISPGYSGNIPDGWQAVLEERNLIWVAANRAGNNAPVQRRALLALLAPTLIERDYPIDRERIYVSGLSGGGKMASMVAVDHAHLFKGAIYNCGVEFWDSPPRRMDEVRLNHYVFVTGTQDQALRPTRRVHAKYQGAGVENVLLMVLEMGHENPRGKDFARAVEFLDSRTLER